MSDFSSGTSSGFCWRMSSISAAVNELRELRLLLELRLVLVSEPVASEKSVEEVVEESFVLLSVGAAPVGVEGCCCAYSRPNIAVNTITPSITWPTHCVHRVIACFIIGLALSWVWIVGHRVWCNVTQRSKLTLPTKSLDRISKTFNNMET